MASIKSVDEYIAAQPEPAQKVLMRVRRAIREALPSATEVISYSMPTYKINDETVLHFAGWDRHYSLYAATKALRAAFKDELAPYKIDKGTIRLPFEEPVPVKLIERIAKFRANEIVERQNEK